MSKLKYGIIGLGSIADWKHLPGYAKLKDEVVIHAVCDIDENKLSNAARKYDIPYTFKDYNELLSMKEIDFVSICLPNYLHAPVTIKALESGKHVHCEKPMAMNALEAREMMDVKNRTGKKLMVGLNNRFTPESMYVKQYIDEGNLGEIYFAKCGWVRRAGIAPRGWFTDKTMSGGGPLIDLGVHFIDLVMHYMNFPSISSVTSKTYCKFGDTDLCQLYTFENITMDMNKKYDVEDIAVGFIELKNDSSICFEISWASNIQAEKLFYDIYGTKGGIRFENGSLKIFSRMNNQLVDIEPKINPGLYKENEFKHFIDCINSDTEPVIAPPGQGVEMMKLIDIIYKSAETGKQVIL